MRTPEEFIEDLVYDWGRYKSHSNLRLRVRSRDAEIRRDTIEKAKARVLALANPGPGMGIHRPSLSQYGLDHVLDALDALLQEEETK